MRYVIVGNSFAGIFAAETIRSVDREGSITIIGEEVNRTYTRALIHEYLAGVIEPSKMYLRAENHYDRLDIHLLAGKKATGLNIAKQTVTVGDETIEYDRLFLGVGGAPFIPPGLEGLDKLHGQVFTFTKFSDAQALVEKCREAQNVVVLGAGLIGLQAAEAFAMMGKKVTVVELADYVLPMVSDPLASRMIQSEMEHEGITFCLSESIDELGGKRGKLSEVRLRSGESIPADIFVIAVGVRPNVDWIREAGVAVDRGVLIDHHARTNVETIYAGGDCAQGPELISGSRMVLATIPIATEQGMAAGYNMASVAVEYRGGIPLNALQFGPLQIISYGYVKEKPGQEVLSVLDEKNRIYKKLVLEDNRLTGALFLRWIDRVGLFRYLIEEKINVAPFKHRLLSPDFGPASLPMSIRQKLFGTRQSRLQIPQPMLVHV
ncbi:MAG: NAD(P)/FAD-dependent oxidoreductase [Phycisphaerae bacterium]|jgi:NAD(P)H-nitrite reductase large subunit|nr:NAD(P)/FAD-dependent oxidoreductase [Phycisphaerae bacterium]